MYNILPMNFALQQYERCSIDDRMEVQAMGLERKICPLHGFRLIQPSLPEQNIGQFSTKSRPLIQ